MFPHKYFIIKVLASDFEQLFECLRENTKKYKTKSFSVRMEKKLEKLIKMVKRI